MSHTPLMRRALIPADGQWHKLREAEPISEIKAPPFGSIDIDSSGVGWCCFPPLELENGEAEHITVHYRIKGD